MSQALKQQAFTKYTSKRTSLSDYHIWILHKHVDNYDHDPSVVFAAEFAPAVGN